MFVFDADEEMEQDKKKLESMADVMKNPTKVVLLLVSLVVLYNMITRQGFRSEKLVCCHSNGDTYIYLYISLLEYGWSW